MLKKTWKQEGSIWYCLEFGDLWWQITQEADGRWYGSVRLKDFDDEAPIEDSPLDQTIGLASAEECMRWIEAGHGRKHPVVSWDHQATERWVAYVDRPAGDFQTWLLVEGSKCFALSQFDVAFTAVGEIMRFGSLEAAQGHVQAVEEFWFWAETLSHKPKTFWNLIDSV